MKTIISIAGTVCRIISVTGIAVVIFKAVHIWRLQYAKKTDKLVYGSIRAAAEKLEKTASALQEWADQIKHNAKRGTE